MDSAGSEIDNGTPSMSNYDHEWPVAESPTISLQNPEGHFVFRPQDVEDKDYYAHDTHSIPHSLLADHQKLRNSSENLAFHDNPVPSMEEDFSHYSHCSLKHYSHDSRNLHESNTDVEGHYESTENGHQGYFPHSCEPSIKTLEDIALNVRCNYNFHSFDCPHYHAPTHLQNYQHRNSSEHIGFYYNRDPPKDEHEDQKVAAFSHSCPCNFIQESKVPHNLQEAGAYDQGINENDTVTPTRDLGRSQRDSTDKIHAFKHADSEKESNSPTISPSTPEGHFVFRPQKVEDKDYYAHDTNSIPHSLLADHQKLRNSSENLAFHDNPVPSMEEDFSHYSQCSLRHYSHDSRNVHDSNPDVEGHYENTEKENDTPPSPKYHNDHQLSAGLVSSDQNDHMRRRQHSGQPQVVEEKDYYRHTDFTSHEGNQDLDRIYDVDKLKHTSRTSKNYDDEVFSLEHGRRTNPQLEDEVQKTTEDFCSCKIQDRPTEEPFGHLNHCRYYPKPADARNSHESNPDFQLELEEGAADRGTDYYPRQPSPLPTFGHKVFRGD